ncbi:MAG: NUDIX hydrolase [Gammaproteobacteria bacterium]|nr:NUDIX hydrolase [Gammaproteobacteria bacterium]
MQRSTLIRLLTNYTGFDEQEESTRLRMLSFVQEHDDCFERSLKIGHITGSAWIVNRQRTKTLMLHHRKLDRWLQPGGHSDGDPNTPGVALKEASEESGVQLKNIRIVDTDIFDVDIHTIPATKKEPQHEHYDVRFLFEIDDTLPLRSNDESNEVRWLDLDEVKAFNPDRSIERMLEKTRNL